MKHLVKFLALAGFLAFGVTGCGDDAPSSPTPNPNDPTSVQFKTGDTLRYNHYFRDVNDNRDYTTKTVKVWTVLNANASIGGKSGVSVIEERSFDSTGTAPMGVRDTFYIQGATDGKLYWYNLLRSVVKRIPSADIFIDSVPAKWIEIGTVKSGSAASWQAIEGGPITKTISIGSFSGTVNLSIQASQASGGSVTVPAGTYATTFAATHNVIITTNTPLGTSVDTLRMNYSLSPKDGILRQSLRNGRFSLMSQDVPGFDLELVSVKRAQ
jgi:hypothetical protein